MSKGGYVYIMSSPNHTTLYVGMTSNLNERIWQHRTKFYQNSFTAKYNCCMLVYYCWFNDINLVIAEEKRIKGGNRAQKDKLVFDINPDYRDLWNDIQ